MKKIITYCDECNQEIEAGKVINADERHDLCEGCARKILRTWFEMKVIGAQPCEEPEEKPVKKTRKKVEKIGKKTGKQIDRGVVRNVHPTETIDLGKLQSLIDAGWPVSKIAEEMHCCEAIIREYAKPPKPRKKRDWEFVEDEIKREAQPV